jgi:phosphatidylethanolamine/phosphatidyl-N-methylethanolamine N-methyltransferase
MSELDSFYKNQYQRFIGTGIVGFVASLTHKTLEYGRHRPVGEVYKILEVGAGGGQHIKFCKQNYSEYIMTDLRPENLPESRGKAISNKERVPADLLPYPSHNFDRVIATCLIAHIAEPEKALQEWLRVLKDSGDITIYVPCEPGILLRILQNLVTNPKKRRQGVENPTLIHYRDHAQTYLRIKLEIMEVSKKVVVRRYPFPFLSWNFNLWAVFKIQK